MTHANSNQIIKYPRLTVDKKYFGEHKKMHTVVIACNCHHSLAYPGWGSTLYDTLILALPIYLEKG